MEKSRWELTRKKSGGLPMDESETEELKAKLYPYLKDKAARRESATSGANYAGYEKQFAEDQGRYDAGALLGSMSKMQSQAGTLGDKRSDVEIVDPMNKALNDSSQQRYKNELALRENEDSAINTDLRVGQFVAGLDEKDKARKDRRREFDADLGEKQAGRGDRRDELRDRLQAERDAREAKKGVRTQPYKESDMISPDGSSYVFDPESGAYKPSALPKGAKPYQRPLASGAGPGFGTVVPGYTDANGNPVTYNPKTGTTGTVQLPEGAKSTKVDPANKPLTGEEKNASMYYANAEKALKVLEEMEAKGYRPGVGTAFKTRFTPRELEGKVFSADEQRYMQAARDYTAAKLRLESGASIAPSEIDQQASIYMLGAGEDQATSTEKQRSRRQALLGLKFKSGRGAGQIEKVPDSGAKKSVDDMSEEEVDAELRRRGLVK